MYSLKQFASIYSFNTEISSRRMSKLEILIKIFLPYWAAGIALWV
jgi:hypothetical protein